MPKFVHPAFPALLLKMLNGTAARPDFVYMGLRTNAPQAYDNQASVTELSGGGYVRSKIPTSSLVVNSSTDPVMTIPQQLFGFTGFADGATHWFLCDTLSSTSGNLYASGPLNPTGFSATLTAPLAAGATSLVLPTATVTSRLVSVADYLNFGLPCASIGSGCGSTQELVKITAVGADSGGNTAITFTPTGFAHPSGEAYNRDGCTRYYVAGYTDRINAAIMFQSTG